MKVSNKYSKSVHAPNMGFGVSFVLPIIVDGLVAKKGRFFIIENPEGVKIKFKMTGKNI